MDVSRVMCGLLSRALLPLVMLGCVVANATHASDTLALLQERPPPPDLHSELHRLGLDMTHAALLDDLASQTDELTVRFGCTDSAADNFDANATTNDGSCFKKATFHLKAPQLAHGAKDPESYVHSETQRMHPEDALVMYQMADLVGKLFNEANIVWWAADGSLLGAIRNKGIIPHDDDVDYNILEDQVETVLSQTFQDRLEANGLKLYVPKSAWLKDRLYIWNATSYDETRGDGTVGKANEHGTKMKLDLWPMRRTATALSGLVDEDRELRKEYIEAGKEIGPPRHFPRDLCVDSEEFKDMQKDYPTRMTAGVHVGDWHCALKLYPFGKGKVYAPSISVAERYLTSRYTEWRTDVACQGTLHHCMTIANNTWDIVGHAEPDSPLLDLKK